MERRAVHKGLRQMACLWAVEDRQRPVRGPTRSARARSRRAGVLASSRQDFYTASASFDTNRDDRGRLARREWSARRSDLQNPGAGGGNAAMGSDLAAT